MMKSVVFALLAFACVALALPSAYEPGFRRFVNWMKVTGHRYPSEDIDRRYSIYLNSEKRVAQKNADSEYTKYDLTFFSALNSEEFNQYPCGLTKMSDSFLPEGFVQPVENFPAAPASVPEKWDWTAHGASSEVKDQQDCASCGVFSAVGAIEGAWNAKNSRKVSLSEQQMIDCNPSSRGCTGTWPVLAFQSTLEQPMSGRIASSEVYPCDSCFIWVFEKRSQCKFTPESTAVTIKGFSQYCHIGSAACDEEKMAATLFSNGPLSVCLDVAMFQDYSSGILIPNQTDCNAETINHCVTLVGYGKEGDNKYWKVKNTWGPKWGEEGYARIARGVGACGINKVVSAVKF